MATDLKGLNKFRKRLENYSIGEDFASVVAEEIADAGIKIATGEYQGKKVELDKRVVRNGEIQIIASAKGIQYMEFGTGEYAKGTYRGTLPSQGVPITGKWQHYYEPSEHKHTINGVKGWFIKNGVFVTGQTAGNQMFYTSDKLRKQIPKIIKKKFGKGVKK